MEARVLLLLLLLPLSSPAQAASAPNLPVAGWLERARLSPGHLVLQAKLDTGARTSSLHATNVRVFDREGAAWVAFDVRGDDGREMRIERPLLRLVRVKSALGADESRPAVMLGICIGRVYRVTEVNLADRSKVSRPLLIGRAFLRGHLLVDLNRRHVLEPSCREDAVP